MLRYFRSWLVNKISQLSLLTPALLDKYDSLYLVSTPLLTVLLRQVCDKKLETPIESSDRGDECVSHSVGDVVEGNLSREDNDAWCSG